MIIPESNRSSLLPSQAESDLTVHANQESQVSAPVAGDRKRLKPTEGAAAASAKIPEPPRRAILVIHGIGLQQPFQPLDSFVNGLRATLKHDRKRVEITHFMHGRDKVFDHSVRVETTDQGGKQPNLCLDVYEFYWAPLTRGKASFAQIVRWLLITGFTPVRRLAFNLPLLIQRAERQAKVGFSEGQSRPAAPSTPATPGLQPGPSDSVSLLRRAQTTVAKSKAFWLFVEFLRELWRLVYVSLVAAGLAGLAAGLISQSSALAKRIPEALGLAFQTTVTWRSSATFTFALVTAVAALGLALSIPEQIRDLMRLQKVEPIVFDEVGQAARSAYNRGSNFLGKVFGGAWAGLAKLVDAATARAQWRIELQARRWLLPLSIVCFALARLVGCSP